MIIGVDPSLCSTGVCVDGHNTFLIKTQPEQFSSVPRIDTARRVTFIVDSIREVLTDHSLNTNIFVESPMLNAQSTGAVGHLFEMGWLWGELYRQNWMIHEVAPTSLKKFASGKGNTPKQKMQLICYKKWGVEFDNDPGLDKVHAYCLYQYGLAVVSGEIEHVPQKRRGAKK